MSLRSYTLKNGIKVVHQYAPSVNVSHCGLILDIGSRDEKASEHGLAHLIEHCLFKGTEKRKSFHVLSRLDAVGGELNAYTTKEELCVYASFINEYYERAIELISDVVFNSVFPDKEIEKEKEVILDEINSYADSHVETLFEDFEGLIYGNHSLSRTILGTPEKVKAYTRKDILKFLDEVVDTSRIVFSSVGNIPHDKFRKLVEKHLEPIPQKSASRKRKKIGTFSKSDLTIQKESVQSHWMYGCSAYGLKDEKRKVLVLLSNILGGSGMNSKLNLNIREKYGYTYNIEANYSPFIDTGNFNIYFSCEPGNLDRVKSLVHRELKQLKDVRMGPRQFELAKKQLKGHIAIGQDSHSSLMLSIGKSMMHFDEVESLESVYQRIDGITSSDLLEVANEILDESKFSSLTFVPSDKMLD